MTPYYEQDGIIIWHADCRDALPGMQADAVITDPPYGNRTPYADFEDTSDNVVRLMADALPLCRAAAPAVLVTTGIRWMFTYPPPDWVLAWFAPGGTGCGPWGFTTWQPVLAYGKDPYLQRGMGSRPDGLVAQFKRGTFANPKVDHPCPKPLRTMRWLVERATTHSDELIIDPFMGSGTTMEAARMLGRRAIGIEISEKYCEIAAKRLSQGVLL